MGESTVEKGVDNVTVSTKWKWDMYNFMITNFSRFSYDSLEFTTNWLKDKIPYTPMIAIICGSGLGRLADTITEPITISYDDIPNFPTSTVAGHAGQLVFGKLSNVPVVCMKGRFHYYEGYPLWKCAIPIRIFKLLGVTHLILSNAAGGLNPCFKLGDIMIIKDHINMMGYAGNNPLQGPNDDRFGVRFPSLMHAYDRTLIEKAKEIFEKLGIRDSIHEGVYSSVGGPNYETVAENKMLRMCGVDTVGASTVHEVVTARHCGLIIFAFSLVTNVSIFDYETLEGPTHGEIVDVADKRGPVLQQLVTEMVGFIGQS